MAAAAAEVAMRVVAAVTRLKRLLRVRASGLMPAYMYLRHGQAAFGGPSKGTISICKHRASQEGEHRCQNSTYVYLAHFRQARAHQLSRRCVDSHNLTPHSRTACSRFARSHRASRDSNISQRVTRCPRPRQESLIEVVGSETSVRKSPNFSNNGSKTA